MNKIYFFILIIFSSCTTTIDYLGRSYAPTKDPDLYVSGESIERPYKIVGKGYAHLRAFGRSPERIQQKILEKAKSKGADAVLVQDYYLPNADANVTSFYRSDSLGKGLVTTGNSSISSFGNVGYTILFLKYTSR
jgi:hypothetical protein